MVILTFTELFAYLIRIVLVILAIYHIFKREFKPLSSIVMTFALTYLPALLDYFLNIRVDRFGHCLYLIIIFMTMYLGNTRKFYDKFAWWDVVIHLMSGAVFVSFGIAIANNTGQLSAFFTLLFCFCFSLALHVIWEVLEYLSDCVFATDHQRWQKHSPTKNHVSEKAIQPAGLVDTMNDSIVCLLGTIVTCVVWWFIL